VGVGTEAPIAREYPAFEALPEGYEALFTSNAATDACLTRVWFEASARHLMSPSERLRLIGAELAGAPAALLVGRERDRDPLAFGGRSFMSLDSLYSLLYAPLIDERLDSTAALAPICARICDATGGRRPYDVVRLQPLDPGSPAFDALRWGLRANGFAVQTYCQFGNPVEPSRGLSFADYLAGRPSRLRHTMGRAERSLGRRGRVDFVLETGSPGRETRLAERLDSYQRVYAASWKAAEPQATFIAEFSGILAAAGALRLGLLMLDGAPVAAQIWVLWHGRAILYKLAHDRRLDRDSPGTVLTARMIAHMLDTEAANELDFGPGDDPYKSSWASQRRERWGILAFNPKTMRGRLGIVRHIWGRAAKRRLAGFTHATSPS
jgi:hypothetical protein